MATPIRERIIKAFGDRHIMKYWDLFSDVFPQDQYPKAWNYRHEGGPPVGCMPLAKALKALKADVWGMGSEKMVMLGSKR